MSDGIDKIDIYNNSAIMLERKTPDNYLLWIIFIIILVINTLIFIYLYISDFPI